MKLLKWIVSILLVVVSVNPLFGRSRVQGYCERGGQTINVLGYTSSTATPVQRSYAPGCVVTVYPNGGAVGTVNTSGTTVTWQTGTLFNPNGQWAGVTITINSVNYVVSSVASTTSLTLMTSAGTQTAVAYSAPGVLAAIYSDNNGTPLANPFTASTNGLYFFYTDDGSYNLQFSSGGIPSPFTIGDNPVIDPWYSRNAATPQAMTLRGKVSETINLLDWTPCNGGDDTVGILAAISYCNSIGGCKINWPNQTCMATTNIVLSSSNVTIEGSGTSSVLYNNPTDPVANYKGLVIGAPDASIGAYKNVSGALALGATQFTATTHSDAGTLTPGQYILLLEQNSAVSEIVTFDWAQVATANGSTGVVTLVDPLRTAFSGTMQGVQFSAVGSLVQNITVRNLKVMNTEITNSDVMIYPGVAKDVILENVVVSPSAGSKGLATYRTKGLTITNFRQTSIQGTPSEISATVDLHWSGGRFEDENTTAGTAPLTIDYGTAFFDIVGLDVPYANNAGLNILYGVHDGSVSGSKIGRVGGNGNGILARSVQRLVISGNMLGSGDTGISLGDSGLLTPEIHESNSVVTANTYNTWATTNLACSSTNDYCDSQTGNTQNFTGPVNMSGNLTMTNNATITASGVIFANQINVRSGNSVKWFNGANSSSADALWDGSEFAINRSINWGAGNVKTIDQSASIILAVGQITTTAATSDSLSVTGLTTGSHCAYTPVNGAAGALQANVAGIFLTPGTDSVTLHHANANVGAVFNIGCSIN